MFNRYFLEIRNRLLLVVGSWITTVIGAYIHKEILLYLIIEPCANLFRDNFFYFIATNITDIFSVYISLTYFVTFQLTCVLFLYHIKAFLEPGLYSLEIQRVKFCYKLSMFFWFLCIILLNTLVLPLCWDFFLSFQKPSTQSVNIFFEIRAIEYFSLYVVIYYLTVLIGQAFVLVFLVISTLKKRAHFIRRTRRLFYFSFFLTATLVTPPDVVSQLTLGMLLCLFYELTIVIVILTELKLVR